MSHPNPFADAADQYAEGRPYHHARTLRRALAGRTPRLALDVACGTGLAAEFPGGGGFAPERTDRWSDEVMMARPRFAAYLATHSNVAGEPLDRVRAWFEAELAPYFPAGEPRPVSFRASYLLLRRGGGEPGRAAAAGAAAVACAGRAGG